MRRARGQSRLIYCVGVGRGERSGRGNDNQGIEDDLCGELGEWPRLRDRDASSRCLEAAVKRFVSFPFLFAAFPLPFLYPPPSLPLSSSVLLSFFALSPFSDRVISY